MASMTDLDQGGTYRQYITVNLGPTLGLQRQPASLLIVNAAGTYNLDVSVAMIQVAVAGLVTLVLPTPLDPPIPVQPGLFVNGSVLVVDVLGTAGSFPITIQTVVGTINNGASAQIAMAYGSLLFTPVPTLGMWIATFGTSAAGGFDAGILIPVIAA
jgi:hypothetical protein